MCSTFHACPIHAPRISRRTHRCSASTVPRVSFVPLHGRNDTYLLHVTEGVARTLVLEQLYNPIVRPTADIDDLLGLTEVMSS